MEENSAATQASASPPLPSSEMAATTTTTTTPLVVAMVAGLVGVVAMVWWRCRGRCSRQLELRRVVRGEKEALFRFLSDPAHLRIIHPYTTEIRMKSETTEEGGNGVMLKTFDWVEKVPFTVVSAARMRCDPLTSTITIDIVPAGSIHKVHLKWWFTADEPENSSAVSEGKSDAADARTATSGASDAKADTGTRSPRSNEWRSSTVFHNEISVTGPGPCLLIVCLVLKLVKQTGQKLMGNVQSHFDSESGDG